MKRTLLLATLAAFAVAVLAADASAMYHPGMGVFMNRDPGAGGAMRAGAGGAAPVGQFIPRDQYRDGMSLYQYVRSNPINRVDPTGQWSKDLHYQATYDAAMKVGYSDKCARVLASWDQGVDDWTGASLFTWYHFNKDVDGNPFGCGRDCWFKTRWDKGVDKLKQANVYESLWIWDVSLTDGLAHVGASLHHRQDSFAHNASHNAETPFDHAPSVICLLWGDGFGIIHQRCIDAKANNANWFDPHRPDKKDIWAADWNATVADTESLLKEIWQIPTVRCHCKK